MVNNFRPTQNMYHRPVRTNIDFTNGRNLNCPTMARQMYYTGELRSLPVFLFFLFCRKGE
ncbi:hypothetical protein E2C01_079485 [Portunus trituberculatus]|uniref:Uncharacterized protein n=1 Tax=Portunus trituberculatus TaxID=210409 RepID=A0A5B7ISW5_PORTR|nr:hypothetical protein [Portunus trituberculatus]